jgi:hypothetical protein
MVRLFASSIILSGIFAMAIPVEQPAASAANWVIVPNTNWCVDTDTIKSAGTWVAWNESFPKDGNCPIEPNGQKMDCSQDLSANFVWYDVEGTPPDWHQEHVRANSILGEIARYVCARR